MSPVVLRGESMADQIPQPQSEEYVFEDGPREKK